ncbi:MAG: hypothetical protein GY946_07215, partial [bacterium]|nr:hypothetical protein [bacterium]
MARNYLNLRDAARALRADLHDPRYEEPIRLALGIRSHVDASGHPSAEDLFDGAILAGGELAQADPDFFQPAEFEDLLHRDRNFAWRASNDDLRMHSTTAKELAKPWVAQIETASGVFGGQTFGEVGSALRPHIVPTLRDLAADTNTNDD